MSVKEMMLEIIQNKDSTSFDCIKKYSSIIKNRKQDGMFSNNGLPTNLMVFRN